MQTLVEFVRFTKGWEYLIAIAFILTFLSFWRLLSKEQPLRAGKPAPEKAMVPLRQPFITVRWGGQFVSAGTFLHLKSWEFTTIPRPWGYLPGTSGQRYIGIHPVLAVVVGPLLGLLFVIMLPPLGVGMILVSLSRRLYQQFARAARLARNKGSRTTVR